MINAAAAALSFNTHTILFPRRSRPDSVLRFRGAAEKSEQSPTAFSQTRRTLNFVSQKETQEEKRGVGFRSAPLGFCFLLSFSLRFAVPAGLGMDVSEVFSDERRGKQNALSSVVVLRG